MVDGAHSLSRDSCVVLVGIILWFQMFLFRNLDLGGRVYMSGKYFQGKFCTYCALAYITSIPNAL